MHVRRLGTLSSKYEKSVKLSEQYGYTWGNHPSRPPWPYYRITFMDASNVFWVRDSLGVLRETSPSLPRPSATPKTISEMRGQALNESTREYHNTIPVLADGDLWEREIVVFYRSTDL